MQTRKVIAANAKRKALARPSPKRKALGLETAALEDSTNLMDDLLNAIVAPLDGMERSELCDQSIADMITYGVVFLDNDLLQCGEGPDEC